jgi:hypothetical protein
MREALHDLNKTLMPCDGTSEPHIDGRRETEPSGVLAVSTVPHSELGESSENSEGRPPARLVGSSTNPTLEEANLPHERG